MLLVLIGLLSAGCGGPGGLPRSVVRTGPGTYQVECGDRMRDCYEDAAESCPGGNFESLGGGMETTGYKVSMFGVRERREGSLRFRCVAP